MRRYAAWALAAMSLVTTLAGAQQEPASKPQFGGQASVNEVLLDAVVTDRQGNVVVGLGKDDFKVTEDGKPVQLQDVTFYSNRQLLASPEVAAKLGPKVDQVPVDRYFVLFFHDSRTQLPRVTAQMMDAARWAKNWVKDDLTANDHVAVVSYDVRLHVQQDFSTNQKQILDAIDAALVGRDVDTAAAAGGDPSSLLAHLPSGKDLARKTTRIYGALQELARASGSIAGRKNLILFSIGFGEADNMGFYIPDPRYYPQTVHTLNANNVAVYPIDLIPSSGFGPLRTHVQSNSLSQIADDTGGHYYFDYVTPLIPLERVAEDNSGYYLLSYESPHPAAESGYQKVRVETTNPDFKVRAREGYLYGSASRGEAAPAAPSKP